MSIAFGTLENPFMRAPLAVIDAWVFGHPGAKLTDIGAYAKLACLAGRDTGLFFAKIEEIAEHFGVHPRTAQARIDKLISLGLLQRRHMWIDPTDPGGRPQHHTVVANGQRASDFRLLRERTGFPDDAFTRSLSAPSQCARAGIAQTSRPDPRGNSSVFREDEVHQGGVFVRHQGGVSVRHQGGENATHNRELSPEDTQQRTKTSASPLRAAGPTTAEPDDLDRARRGERTNTAMTLPPDFRGNPATRAVAAELGLDHDAAVRALRTAEDGDTATNWGGTLVKYMRTVSGHTDDLQHTHRWQDADELYAEALNELHRATSDEESLTEGSASPPGYVATADSPVDPPATQQYPPTTPMPTGQHREPTARDEMLAECGIATAVPVHLQPKFTGGDASKDRAGALNLDHGRAVAGFIEWCRDTDHGPSCDWSAVFAAWLAAVVEPSPTYRDAHDYYDRASATPPPNVVIHDFADELACPF